MFYLGKFSILVHFSETDFEIGDGDVGVHPRMLKNFLERDTLVLTLQHLGNEILGLLAHSCELRNCIAP